MEGERERGREGEREIGRERSDSQILGMIFTYRHV